ncbi:MAG: acyltransferase [Pseudomonadota bacterium]
MQSLKKLAVKTYFRLKLVIFYIRNKHKYKRLEFKALIIKPLRIDGEKYISLLGGVVVQAQSWLYAQKIDGCEPELILNKGCIIGHYNHIAAVRRVVLGEHVLTADRVYISDNTHEYENIHIPVMHQGAKLKSEVTIGEGSWIGENVCIIGAKIGKHCVIGANAVVLDDIPDYSVAVGVPARVAKQYNLATGSWERVQAPGVAGPMNGPMNRRN